MLVIQVSLQLCLYFIMKKGNADYPSLLIDSHQYKQNSQSCLSGLAGVQNNIFTKLSLMTC